MVAQLGRAEPLATHDRARPDDNTQFETLTRSPNVYNTRELPRSIGRPDPLRQA